MKRRVTLLLAVSVSVIAGAVGVLWYQLHRDFHHERREAESAVLQTVEAIRGMGALDSLSLHSITNAASRGASVAVLSTNPVVFRVSAHTPWPDWMIYEYDSKTPERGVYHYLF